MGNVTVTSNVNTRNLTATGTLGVTGATTLSSTLAAGNTTITGTLSTTSCVGVGTTTPTLFGAFAVRLGVSNYWGRTVSGSFSDAANSTLEIGHAPNVIFFDTEGSALKVQSSGAVITNTSSTGLAVTGLLSNSTDFTCGGTGYVTNMAGGTVMNIKGAQAGGYAMGLQHTNANPVGMYLYYSTDTNDAAHAVVRFDGAVNCRYQLFSNGGISNYQANDSNLSDLRTKKNIELAGNYLDKICAIPVKTFLYKDQTDEFLNLGVIAQDVEAVAPELIDSGGFGDTPEDGVPLKSIYQTDLQFALMKAIQELAAKVAKLEAA